MAPDELSGSDLDLARPGSLAALYVRVATTLEQSAKLADQHAARLFRNGDEGVAAAELTLAERARADARRCRDIAAQLRQRPQQ